MRSLASACPGDNGQHGNFIAYDAVNLTVLRRFGLGGDVRVGTECPTIGFAFQKFTPPVVANGRVYVPTGGDFINTGWVLVYGLAPQLPIVTR